MRRSGSVVLGGLLGLSCAGTTTWLRPALESEGAVYVYVAARGTSLVFESVGAVRDDGETVPLEIALREVEGGGAGLERLVAHGALSPGGYRGLAIAASTRPGAGSGAAGAPSATVVRVEAPFAIARRRAVVVALAEAPTAGSGAAPVFEARVPPVPPTGLLGLVSSREGDTVTLFDKSSGRVASVIPTGRGPAGLALDTARRRAYVALSAEDAIEVIDLLSGTVVDRVRLAGGDGPLELALTADGRSLLVVNEGSSTVSVVDADGLVETDRIAVGSGPTSVVVDRAGTRAWVLNAIADTISVLDLSRGGGRATVSATIATEPGPWRAGLDRRGERLFVAHRASSYVTVLDTAASRPTRRLFVGGGVTALRVDPASDRIYLARRGLASIEVYDPASLLPVDSVPSVADVEFLAFDGEAGRLHMLSSGLRRLRIVSLPSKVPLGELEVGAAPFHVTVVGER